MRQGNAKAAIIGIGHSKVYRRAEETLGKLALDAARAAIADAGLDPSDIDGITTAPLFPAEGLPTVDGVTQVSTGFMARMLGIQPNYSDEGFYLVTQPFVQAVNAVAGGACKYVLVFRALHNPDGRYGRGADLTYARSHAQFSAPYGYSMPSVPAMYFSRYIAKYGATREQMGRFVVRNRANALKWEYGYWYNHRPEQLSLDDYMEARLISDPMCLYDCDMPIQGAGAFVLTTPERAADQVERPAYILGTATAPTAYSGRYGTGFTDTVEDVHETGRYLARNLFENAGISVRDIDVPNLYDAFSVLTPIWAEALGFCKPGEGFAWIADPDKPLNTSSGSLGAGRMHGIAQLMDSALQVTGRAGERQVKGARYAVATMASVKNGGAVIFGAEPG